MSLADELISLLRCPGCSSQSWDLRADGVDDLPRLEGTLCCCNCGQAFDARGGVLDMVPGIVEDRVSALRRRLESPPVAKLYEERLRHLFTPLASPLRAPDRAAWLRDHAPAAGVRAVVDFGCGRGVDLEVMRDAATPKLALGVDLSQVLLAEAARTARERERPNVVFLRADLEDHPLVGPRFAWASCYGVLHRLGRPRQALASLAALLEPGAPFTCLTTVRLPRGGLALGQHALGAIGRVHVFDRDDLEVMVRDAGIELEELRSYGPVALLAGRRAQG
jgi:SAM-dependent methyltransferase